MALKRTIRGDKNKSGNVAHLLPFQAVNVGKVHWRFQMYSLALSVYGFMGMRTLAATQGNGQLYKRTNYRNVYTRSYTSVVQRIKLNVLEHSFSFSQLALVCYTLGLEGLT